jgi:hypothetical protein
MPQSGVPVSPGRTHRGDQEPDTGEGRRLADRRHEPPRPVRAVPARLASIADVTAELDFTPRPRPRRTSGPVAARTAPDADRMPYDRTAPATRSADAPRSRRVALEASSKRADAAGLTTGTGIAGRRTVTIHGRPAEHYSPTTSRRRRPARRPHERDGFRPDRVGFVLVLVAATSSHAATITHRVAGAHRQVARVHARTHRHASAPAVRLRAR